ncbi:hypothetical protein PoB_003917700 [Plakobranchus ocellatus]|uniref:C2H2-type domain-containing protein n=1 Tax=Plakobranchus ocellatus TaxID=259542 RepID=A0AAV4B054_9GAST|nr:hypothetical protein PoB_003917700 [Plakobranchus ocellatus]
MDCPNISSKGPVTLELPHSKHMSQYCDSPYCSQGGHFSPFPALSYMHTLIHTRRLNSSFSSFSILESPPYQSVISNICRDPSSDRTQIANSLRSYSNEVYYGHTILGMPDIYPRNESSISI